MARFTPSANDIRYPRCFIRRLNHPNPITVVDGDVTVDDLYKIYLSGRVNHQGWRFRKEVINAAARLFRNFPFFINLQRDNPHLYGYNYDFLQDTVNYIATGKRRLSIQAWKELMSEHMPPSGDYKTRTVFVVVPEAKYLLNSSTGDVISKWCQNQNGIEDLLLTMVILFGRVWNPIKETVQLHADYYDHKED